MKEIVWGVWKERENMNADLVGVPDHRVYRVSGRLCIFKENMVYEAQRKVILEIAEKESCVIIGRNADFILKDKDNVLNVFIHGDMPEKVARICKLYNVTEEEAEKMMADIDKRRMTNYRFYTDQKWGMANGSALLIVGAILVPVLAWFTQWLNYKLMPQAPSSNNGNKTANSMENSMKTMNTVMPVFSAFMCLSFSIGIGIYWIAGALVRSVQQIVINRHMSSIDMDEVIRKNQEKAAKKREKAGLPPQKITQAATQSVRNIQVQENEEPSAEEKEAARKASTEYYNSNQEYRAGSIAAKANMVKQFDEKNSKKKK